MIRTSCLLLLLATSSVLMAQPLYKWVEPDGSITFSPTEPPAGVKYEVVDGNKENNAQTASGSIDAEPAGVNPEIKIRATEPASVTTQAPRIKMTPAPGDSLPGKSNLVAPAVTAMSAGNPTIPDAATTAFRSVAESSAIRKQRQCQDLKKRVISLERRLKSRLTPDDMDNTVIHMARYQRSFDQHCAQ